MSRLHLWAMIGRLPSVMVKDLECGSSGLLPTLLTLYSLRCLTMDDGSLIGEFEVQHFSNLTKMCHDHGLMHQDLKPEKILFENKKETAPLKAIDVGLSVFFKPGEVSSEIVGSSYYMASEVFKRNYGPEVDVWCAGVILYILPYGVQ
ncbi:hypothetical protein TB1_008382 [Malus domestica]